MDRSRPGAAASPQPGFHMTAFCWLFYTVVFMYLANLPISKDELYLSVLERFWMQSHVAAYLLVAPGLTTVLEALGITVVGAGGGGVSEAGRGKGRGGSGREKSAGKKERKGGKDGKEEGRKEGAAARWLSHLGIVAKGTNRISGYFLCHKRDE